MRGKCNAILVHIINLPFLLSDLRGVTKVLRTFIAGELIFIFAFKVGSSAPFVGKFIKNYLVNPAIFLISCFLSNSILYFGVDKIISFLIHFFSFIFELQFPAWPIRKLGMTQSSFGPRNDKAAFVPLTPAMKIKTYFIIIFLVRKLAE